MKSFRIPLALALLLLCCTAGLIWWNRPVPIDMATYAPADALVYLETNSVPQFAQTIETSELWKYFASQVGIRTKLVDSYWVTLARTGLAPVESVVFARAQLALVMVGLRSSEQGDVLTIRPEAALIVETHTSNWRIKPAAVDAIRRLSKHSFGESNCLERASGSTHYIECSAGANDRRIVGAIDGSVVIIGNGTNAVEHCVQVRRGVRPSLQTNGEMRQLRENMAAASALSFGYVSSANAGNIFSWTAPLLLGGARVDRQMEQLLATSASKIIRSVAWTSRGSTNGIEDRYIFSLEPEVVAHLQAAFEPAPLGDFWKFVPQETESLTIYHQNNPTGAWMAFNSALGLKLDAVSAVVVSSVLRASLVGYGIENPSEILPLFTSPVATLRANSNDETSVLIARLTSSSQLRQIVQKELGSKIQFIEGRNSEADLSREFAAILHEGFVIMGRTASVKSWLDGMKGVKHMSSLAGDFEKLRSDGTVAITTYAADAQRVNGFIATLAALRGTPLSAEQRAKLNAETEGSVYSITETSLTPIGIERRTRSPFGQVSTLASLLQTESKDVSAR